MIEKLRRIRKASAYIISGTFILVSLVSFALSSALGIIKPDEIVHAIKSREFLLFIAATWVWVFVHFWQFLNPVLKWVEYDHNNQDAPHQLSKRLRVLTFGFWGMLVLYAVATPFVFNLAISSAWLHKGVAHTFTFILVQLATAYVIGIPIYLIVLHKLGQLSRFLGLENVYHGVGFKLWHTGAMIPVVSTCLLVWLYSVQTQHFSWSIFLLIGVLLVVAIGTTIISIRNIHHSLRGVQALIARSGATTHHDLSRLRPESTDEIGFLTLAVARVFKRLTDQQSHMHAVVDTAAEGIIVVDAQGRIDTFNVAAETLFGLSAQEARGQALAKFLPALVDKNGSPKLLEGEQEIDGIHHNGRRISMSARVSRMQISEHTMYTYLVADITERKAAQLRHKNAEARYRDLVETAHDLVWSMDAKGTWTYLNKAASTIYGHEPQEMLGRNISEFRDTAYARQESSAFGEILKGKELFQFETVHIDKFGKSHHLSFNAKAHRDLLGNVHKISGTARDISEKKTFEKELTYRAEHDVLTGLFNRRLFQQELERVIARVTRSAGFCGLLYIDLDQFKYVNDTLGHAAGDKLLIEISRLLSGTVREGELLARFGGDEFTVLLYNINAANLQSAGEKFRALFDNYRFNHAGQSINISCSIGATLIDNGTGDADEAMSHADIACHVAKTQGRNCVHIYNRNDKGAMKMSADMGWASRIRDMLDKDGFVQVFQPIVSTQTGHIYDYEVLIRMPCDDGKFILPHGFLETAGRFGLMQSIDRWMVKHAIQRLKELHDAGYPYRFSINLDGKSFDDKRLLPDIRHWLSSTGLDASYLTFEITEHDAMRKLDKGKILIQDLSELGCRFALDDFGRGYSSLNYLKHLPVDIIKIDGSFIKNIVTDKVDQAMIESVVKFGHALHKKVIAECVENVETYNYLKSIDVDYVQGYYLGYPSEKLITSEHLPKFDMQLSA